MGNAKGRGLACAAPLSRTGFPRPAYRRMAVFRTVSPPSGSVTR